MQVICFYSLFLKTPKSTPVVCPLMHCWNWWCSVGDAAARSAAVVLQAAATGLTSTGGLQGVIHNLQEWSNLETATDQVFCEHADSLFIKASGWWFHHFICATVNSDSFQCLIKHTYKFCFSIIILTSHSILQVTKHRKKLPFCPWRQSFLLHHLLPHKIMSQLFLLSCLTGVTHHHESLNMNYLVST